MNKLVETVLGYIKKNDNYLMLLRNKRQNDINKNKYLGIGGHIEKNESIIEAIKREVKEETNLDIIKYDYRGKIFFSNQGYEETIYLFLITDFKGELMESDEGELMWVKEDKLFDLNMWEGDIYFLKPLINSNDFIKLKLVYEGEKLISVSEYETK